MTAYPAVESLMEKYRRPAIMMRRPYPPLDLPRRNSHLGGRPSLPTGFDWPRTSSGTPLHFLVQIDCAELPPSGGVLPKSGVLFFFARVDEEMLWGDDGEPAHDYCRVLFAPTIADRPGDPPEDLPAIMGGGFGSAFADFRLPDEPPVRLYHEWQVEFHPIHSWPDASALEWIEDPALRRDPAARELAHKRAQEYQAVVHAAREAQATRILGWPDKIDPSWGKPLVVEKRFPLPTASADRPFPQLWIFIDRLARNLVAETVKREGWWSPPPPGSRSTGLSPSELQKIRDAAMTWVRMAARHSLDTAPDRGTSAEFAAWLQSLAVESSMHYGMVGHAFWRGMPSVMQYSASLPSAAAQIPHVYFRQTEDHRAHHQMLGNARASQQARPFERDEVLLLQLESDYGVDFMFCDCGHATFWMHKDDLAARRFDKVTASTDGG